MRRGRWTAPVSARAANSNRRCDPPRRPDDYPRDVVNDPFSLRGRAIAHGPARLTPAPARPIKPTASPFCMAVGVPRRPSGCKCIARLVSRGTAIGRQGQRTRGVEADAGVAQLARAPDCGSGGLGFESRHRYRIFGRKPLFFNHLRTIRAPCPFVGIRTGRVTLNPLRRALTATSSASAVRVFVRVKTMPSRSRAGVARRSESATPAWRYRVRTAAV